MTEAKLKCRFCQAVFTGSTRLAPEVLPPESTLPVHAPQPKDIPYIRPLKMRRRSALPAGIVILGLAGVAILAAWLYHNVKQSQTSPPTANPPAAVTPSPEAPPAVTPKTEPAEEPTPASDAPNTEDADKPQAQSRDVEVIECARLSGPAEASATFVGEYENTSSQALRWVRIIVTIHRPDGKIMQALSNQYENIPPRWRGRFSVDASFRFEPGMRITKAEARSQPAPDMRGWALTDWTKDITDEDTLKLTGLASNTTDQTLTKLVVWCDFFTKQGEYVGSAQGTFRQNGKALIPNESVTYDIHFDPKEAGFSSPLLADPRPRLTGTVKEP
ncbi:MAG: hypothetical protein JXA11_05170 [Phycisphaerae bacterium]|nr:hypothetical protein [Phycisphaerae bacterium]